VISTEALNSVNIMRRKNVAKTKATVMKLDRSGWGRKRKTDKGTAQSQKMPGVLKCGGMHSHLPLEVLG